MNILDAAYEVLKLEKKPMKCADLTAEMADRGLRQPGFKGAATELGEINMYDLAGKTAENRADA